MKTRLITLLLIASTTYAFHSKAQCIATTSAGNLSANGSIYTQQQIFGCNFAGDYTTVTIPAGIWTFSTSVSSDFLTLTNTSNSVLMTGSGSIQYASTSAITVRLHIFANSSCGTQSSCRVSYVQRNQIPVPQIAASDTFVCVGEGPVTLTASNTFGSQTYWYSGSCASTPIDSGATTIVNPSSTTTYYAANQFNGALSSCGSLTINIVPLPVVSFSNTIHVACHGDSTGALFSSVGSGTSPFAYTWSNGATTPNIQNLASGAYGLTVTDDYGCIDTISAVVDEPDALASSMSILSEPLCNGDQTGSAEVTVTGGVQPYQYFWTNGDNAALADSLGQGTYIIDILDANGCTLKDTADVAEPQAIVLDFSSLTHVTCPGGQDGALTAVAFGGTGGISFTWSTGGGGNSQSGLPSGVYAVTATDANGCASTHQDTITEPEPIQNNFAQGETTCNDTPDGTLEISSTGGTSPYTYAWSNGGTSALITGLDTGTYLVTITDAANCLYHDTTNLGYLHEDPEIILPDSAKLCTGFSIILDAGNAGSSYQWSTGDSTQSITVNSAGFYAVVIVSPFGCTNGTNVKVYEDACVGIAAYSGAPELKVFPNPSSGVLFIGGLQQETAAVIVRSMDGRISHLFFHVGSNDALQLDELPAGVYNLEVRYEGITSNHRVVIY
jgi:hypothetical protein